ncbi:DNA methyltransferase [Microbacterium thalli]|uniref:DNA methyltransferase n=1 Tax=Microbacterium thalli TaxID=3027921 RepID=UPI0023668791|nr:DNA methyltransferase [Microbacterium thalli]MDD7930095.1 DNA methyltransferase [Microbacterium thalli]
MTALLTLNTGNDGSLDYEAFLREKVAFDRAFGFEVTDDQLSPIMREGHPDFKPHQAAIVKWAVAGGRRAIFARYGLGKSVMQLEVLRLIVEHAHEHGERNALGQRIRRGLVVAPLGVRFDIIRDGRKHLETEVRFIRHSDEIDPDWSGLYVTNYESVRDGKIDVDRFTAVSLDEAAILRSFGSETYQRFLPMFADVAFRFVATATPSPNRHKELIHYAGFLGIMDTGQALTRFFKRDSTKAANLQLYPHKRREFWLWLNTWACFIQRPSDLGFSDAGYDLPELRVHWDQVQTELLSDQVERDGQGVLVRGGAMSTVDAAREKRHTMDDRIARAMSIVTAHHAGSVDGLHQIILWCHLNDEQAALEAGLAAEGLTFSSIHGSLTDTEIEERLRAWLDGETYALIGKPIQLGRGLNLQQASTSVFVGITQKFEETIQAVHRIYRFGQLNACDVHLIYAETETAIRDTLQEKWAEDERLTDTMSEVLREFGLSASAISLALVRAMGVEREEHFGDAWTIALNDSVAEARDHLEENSVGLIVTSIPFGNHYEYSPNYADFGHTDDNAHFWWQNDYLTPSLYRALMPGRMLAVHVKDRLLFGSVTGRGVYTVSELHAEAIAHYRQHGFDYYGMITVTTDVVRENNQTYRLSYTKMLRDHTPMGVGSPEYVLLFHKPQTDRSKGWADERVVKDRDEYSVGRWQIDAAADWRASGDRLLSIDELAVLDPGTRSRLFTQQTQLSVYDYEQHVALAERLAAANALPGTFASLVPGSARPDVWTDILRIETLNSAQRRRNVEQHICPFPLEIPRRLIAQYSNPGELVYDPFSGLGSTVLEAVRQGRRGYGSELNPASVADSLVYLRQHDAAETTPTLFDLLDLEGTAA